MLFLIQLVFFFFDAIAWVIRISIWVGYTEKYGKQESIRMEFLSNVQMYASVGIFIAFVIGQSLIMGVYYRFA